MARKIGLYYFSGTGNTEIVAELLRSAFERNGVEADMVRIEDVLKGKAQLDPKPYDVIGLGHPIHGFDAPRIVHQFIDELSPVNDKPVFVFKSAADIVGINNGASKALIRKLEAKGYRVFYDRIVCMACNWLVGYDDRLAKQLYEAAIAKTAHMCQEIMDGKARTLQIHPLLGMLARGVHWGEDWGVRFFGKELHVSGACIHCGRCVERCPTGNIQCEKGHIWFGWDCVSCMRCIYACPQKAILPRISRFLVLKQGYDIRAIVADSSLKGDFVTKDTRGYFGRLLKYIEDVTL